MTVRDYTKEQREAIVRGFKGLKPYLWDGVKPRHVTKDRGPICYALAESHNCKSMDSLSYDLCSRLILDRLSHHHVVMVHAYLANLCTSDGTRLLIPEHEMTAENIQAFRHRWVDELIREFSAPEDDDTCLNRTMAHIRAQK